MRLQRIDLALVGRAHGPPRRIERDDRRAALAPVLREFAEAGGEDVLGNPGEPSEELSWDVAIAAKPDVVIVMPCGRDAHAALDEALEFHAQLAAVGAKRVIAVDASAYYSRPGPRLVDGLELLSALLHPTSGITAPEGSYFELR